MTTNKAIPFSQPHDTPLKPADVVGTEGTVTMFFPRKVLLTLDDHRRVEFNPGIQEVPLNLADHQYLKLNGVTRHDKTAPATVEQEQAKQSNVVLGEPHVKFLQDRGYPVMTVEHANKFFNNLMPEERVGFLYDFAQTLGKPKMETILSSPAHQQTPAAGEPEEGGAENEGGEGGAENEGAEEESQTASDSAAPSAKHNKKKRS
jgi:hypothetical protein